MRCTGWNSKGVVFDRDAEGRLQLGREGGYDRSRIVHAGGDATGAKVMQALSGGARCAIQRVDVDGLVLRDGRVYGGVYLLEADGTRSVYMGGP